MILSREEFVKYASLHIPDYGAGNPDSPFWFGEASGASPSEWFLCIDTISWGDNDFCDEFWAWCDQHCQGQVRCHASGEDLDWWGFTHREDIELWILRWSGR